MDSLNLSIEKQPHETDYEYIGRLCDHRNSLGLSWKELAEHANKELKLSYTESWYRKNYNKGAFTKVEETIDEDYTLDTWQDSLNAREEDLKEKLHKINLRRAEVADLVCQNNSYIRRLSREQTIKEVAHDYAQLMCQCKRLITPFETIRASQVSKKGLLLLSDWHYGMEFENPWNKYNPDICKQRVSFLRDKVIDLIKLNKITDLVILDLGDLIAGRIHSQIKIESRFDVITQTMDVCEILAELLTDLSVHCNIKFYSSLDNHSRLEPNKKESLELETLARLIPWYLTERLAHNQNVEICSNEYGEDIITCNVFEKNIAGVHGDADKPQSVLERISLLTRQYYHMLCTAHLHHFFCDEVNETLIIGNPSLMGTDNYSTKLRLTSEPAQVFIISNKNNLAESIHRIVLNNCI